MQIMGIDYADHARRFLIGQRTVSRFFRSFVPLCCISRIENQQRQNARKTKTMDALKQSTQRPYREACTLTVEQVGHFTYLGAVISADGTLDKDLDSRIGKALRTF